MVGADDRDLNDALATRGGGAGSVGSPDARPSTDDTERETARDLPDRRERRVLDGHRDLRLSTAFVGRRIHRLRSVESTNATLRDLARAGEPEGTVVIADEQTSGRGRSGRVWFSPAHLGVWASILLKPQLAPQQAAALSIVTAVAAADVLASDLGIETRVKWPNDIMVGALKLGGVLVETGEVAGGPVEEVIVGVGINVGQSGGGFPIDIADRATSLEMVLGRAIDRMDVLRSLLTEFEGRYREFLAHGFGPARDRWRELSSTRGRGVEIATAGRTVIGTVTDLSLEGALVVRTEAGDRVEFWHGDVARVR